MTTLRSRIIAWAGRMYLARTQKKGFDLSRMSFLPESVLMPLRRDGLNPVGDLAAVREREPVSKLPVPIAANVWLVTGYDEVKAVLERPMPSARTSPTSSARPAPVPNRIPADSDSPTRPCTPVSAGS